MALKLLSLPSTCLFLPNIVYYRKAEISRCKLSERIKLLFMHNQLTHSLFTLSPRHAYIPKKKNPLSIKCILTLMIFFHLNGVFFFLLQCPCFIMQSHSRHLTRINNSLKDITSAIVSCSFYWVGQHIPIIVCKQKYQ